MLDFYYWPTPNGWKISIMLEECGLPYKLVQVNIGKCEQFRADTLTDQARQALFGQTADSTRNQTR